MLTLSGSLRPFLALEPCDMRKSFDGLHAEVLTRLGEDPRGGAVFVSTDRYDFQPSVIFINRITRPVHVPVNDLGRSARQSPRATLPRTSLFHTLGDLPKREFIHIIC